MSSECENSGSPENSCQTIKSEKLLTSPIFIVTPLMESSMQTKQGRL
jgi:hypothetical protein